MLSALFSTYAKFLMTHHGLISDNAVRRHFRQNILRFWRRIRKEAVVAASSRFRHTAEPFSNARGR